MEALAKYNGMKFSHYNKNKFFRQLLATHVCLKFILLLFIPSQFSAVESIDLSNKKSSMPQQWYFIAPKTKNTYSHFFKKIKTSLPDYGFTWLDSNELKICESLPKDSYVVTSGIHALRTIHACEINKPSFSFYVTQQQFQQLEEINPENYHNTNVFFVDQPLIRQLALSHYFLPKKNKVAIIYSASTKKQIISLKKDIPEFYRVNSKQIDDTTNILKQLQRLTGASDFILALVDNKVFNSNNAKSILLTTYRRGKPLFGGTRGFVKAGIVASCFSNPEILIDEFIESLKSFGTLSGLRQFPQHFEIIQNPAVAHSLDLKSVTDKSLKAFVVNKLKEWEVKL